MKPPPIGIKQRRKADCGVAAVAMATGQKYELVEKAFQTLGFDVARKGKAPFASSFQDAQAALHLLGHQGRLRRFRSWSQISGASIVKVRNMHKRNWHWVFATHVDPFGLVIHDPSNDLSYLEFLCDGAIRLPLDHFDPYGCFLECSPRGNAATTPPG